MNNPLEAMALPSKPAFSDLIFRPHPDGNREHFQALHNFMDSTVSVTLGGMNLGEPGAPYEMQGPDGEIHAPLTPEKITELLCTYQQTASETGK